MHNKKSIIKNRVIKKITDPADKDLLEDVQKRAVRATVASGQKATLENWRSWG